MVEIMTVCTGNICRSPLAALLIDAALGDGAVRVHSAGTRALVGEAMTPEAQRLATARGVRTDAAAAHRARLLTEAHLASPDLILTMAREHRRAVAELAPARLRSTFTVREFARLSASVPEEAMRSAADAASVSDVSLRLRAAVGVIAGQRGLVLPPGAPDDDDVIDPYRRSSRTYELSGAQLDPAIAEVIRVVQVTAP